MLETMLQPISSLGVVLLLCTPEPKPHILACSTQLQPTSSP